MHGIRSEQKPKTAQTGELSTVPPASHRHHLPAGLRSAVERAGAAAMRWAPTLVLILLIVQEAYAQEGRGSRLVRRRRRRRLQGAGATCTPQGFTSTCATGLRCICSATSGQSSRRLEEVEGRRLFGMSRSSIQCTCVPAPPPPSPPPASPPPPPDLIRAGGHHTFAALPYTTLKVWGHNSQGSVGDGSTSHRSTPVTINVGGGGVKDLAGGWHSSCALLMDGSLKCWGQNNYGQIGDGSTSNRNTPTVVNVGGTVVAVQTARYTTCAILDGGTLKCFGENTNGQIGDGSTSHSAATLLEHRCTLLLPAQCSETRSAEIFYSSLGTHRIQSDNYIHGRDGDAHWWRASALLRGPRR